jgi:hypothetical protein
MLEHGLESYSTTLQNDSKPNTQAHTSVHFHNFLPYLVTFACHEETRTKLLQTFESFCLTARHVTEDTNFDCHRRKVIKAHITANESSRQDS